MKFQGHAGPAEGRVGAVGHSSKKVGSILTGKQATKKRRQKAAKKARQETAKKNRKEKGRLRVAFLAGCIAARFHTSSTRARL